MKSLKAGLSGSDGMLDALEKYYGLQYGAEMKRVIGRTIATLPREYLLELYVQIINTHTIQYKQLPDMAIIRRIQDKMGPVATYLPPTGDETAPPYDPELDAKIKRELEEKRIRDGERNHREREKVRGKVLTGDATRWERRWIAVIDDYDGDWRRATRDLGLIDDGRAG